jgi:DNA-binding winged helix-turn-helix (wHTH) protein/tetratricopeptide (TPR) repeat protein
MAQHAAFLEFGGFRIDVANRLLLRGDAPVALTPKAFDTLWTLVDQRHRVVPKDELLEAVWPGTFVTEATLTQNVYVLRKALDDGDGKRWIRTVPRRGYRFDGTVTPVAAPPEGSGDQAADRRVGAARSRSQEIEVIRSLAVLPLHPLAPGAEDAFLGLGLADAVITSLSNVRQLAVRATSAILRYVDVVERDPVVVGRELAVDGVLEGTVQHLGTRLRVTLQLVSVARGVACWAESFQGAYSDLFVAQEAIAREVVARLRVTLTRQEDVRLTERPTHSLEAYRTYVRGRYFWNRRTAADLRRAIELFREAVALDPDYARAYSGLADALILLPFYGSAQPTESFRQAREAARRALNLDDSLAEAHTSLAYTDFVYSRDWQTAENGFRHAMACSSDYPTAYHWYAFMLTALGRHQEAIQLATRAHELEPFSLVISTDLAMAYYFARRIDEAVDQLTGVLEVAPSFGYAHFALAFGLSELGRHASAVAAARRATDLLTESGAARAALGYTLAHGGYHDEARQVLESLRQDRRSSLASHRALVLAGLGDLDQALAELRRGSEERSRFVAFLGVWPAFDPLRSDPRFHELLKRLGLDRDDPRPGDG